MTVALPDLVPMVPFRTNAVKLKRRAAVTAAFHLGLFGALLVLWTPTAVMCVSRLHESVTVGSSAAAIGAGAVEVWLVLIFLQGVVGLVKGKLRVVPYFSQKQSRAKVNRRASEESSTAFHGGFGIAADLPRLDDLARELHVTPLSAFGFGDDLFKQRPQWSHVADGLRTALALIERIETDGVSAPMRVTTFAELKALVAALQKAQENQTSFALILRHSRDDFISGYEMSKREGSFWC